MSELLAAFPRSPETVEEQPDYADQATDQGKVLALSECEGKTTGAEEHMEDLRAQNGASCPSLTEINPGFSCKSF